MIPKHLADYIRNTKLVVRKAQNVTEGAVFILASINISRDQAAEYVKIAIERGARYVVLSKELQDNSIPSAIYVDSTAEAWAYAASLIYEHHPKIINAVTGTSGKTTVAYLCSQIASRLLGESLYIGTLGFLKMKENNSSERIADSLTTPDAMDLRRIFCEQANLDYTCIEASSHGIEQSRLKCLPVSVAAFTNLSPEHLDYHGSMESYFRAKKKLFTSTKTAAIVLNIDDEFGSRIKYSCKHKRTITYGKSDTADVRIMHWLPGESFDIRYRNVLYSIKCNFLGEYNIYNLTCAISMLLSSGFELREILAALNNGDSVQLPPGRMELVSDKPRVYVDYAHKPDALDLTLNAVREYRSITGLGRIWVIFGCGGNRDISKRPVMGEIASRLADVVIITDDNPRYENPAQIRKEIISGITSDYIEIGDRRRAIEYAISNCDDDDIILIAGKGHENYQINGDVISEFSDVAVAREFLLKK